MFLFFVKRIFSSFSNAYTFSVQIYLQSRMTWRGSKLLKHFLQYILLMMAWFTCMSRISDYKHHWSDVLAGGVIGITCATIIVSNSKPNIFGLIFVLFFFNWNVRPKIVYSCFTFKLKIDDWNKRNTLEFLVTIFFPLKSNFWWNLQTNFVAELGFRRQQNNNNCTSTVRYELGTHTTTNNGTINV